MIVKILAAIGMVTIIRTVAKRKRERDEHRILEQEMEELREELSWN